MRGLYGQAEGNERRSNFEQFGDRLADNQIVEGTHVATMRRMVGEGKLGDVAKYLDRLKGEGHSKLRRDSMLSRAMAGQRL